MNIPFVLVDAFAHAPFTGNPAGVLFTEQPLEAELMQNIAMEVNQAETAFLTPQDDGVFSLRWFTPTVEVDLCGHATLASAHSLWENGHHGELRFSTRSGILSASQVGDEIELDFPSEKPHAESLPVELPFLQDILWTGRNRMDWVVQISSEARVRALQPDFLAIGKLGGRGLIVTAQASDVDFVSRGFFPLTGIDEDPVTGSAHCALAPFWAERLGRNALTGYQASRRGGFVTVELVGDRVKLRGKAMTTLRGELIL